MHIEGADKNPQLFSNHLPDIRKWAQSAADGALRPVLIYEVQETLLDTIEPSPEAIKAAEEAAAAKAKAQIKAAAE